MFNREKRYLKTQKDIVRLIESSEGCIATDRITVDGCQVGYMYRENPTNGKPDSGWRFMAGDEDEEYMNTPSKHSVYQLNTVCNYDPDIIPFLDSKPGTAFFRDEDGRFVLDEDWELEE